MGITDNHFYGSKSERDVRQIVFPINKNKTNLCCNKMFLRKCFCSPDICLS